MDSQTIRLMETKHLKTNFWSEAAQRGMRPVFVYDADLDVLMLLFADPTTPKITHYLDEHMALLYRRKDGEIVGLRVDAFRTVFLPLHRDLQGAWLLRRTWKILEDISELRTVIDEQEQKVAREVSRIARPIVERAGVRMPALA